MGKSPQYNQQTEPKQCKSEVEEIYVFTKNWKVAVTAHRMLYLKIDSAWVPCQKESQGTISENSHVQYVYDHAAQIYTLNRPSGWWCMRKFEYQTKTGPVCFRGHSFIKSSHGLRQIDVARLYKTPESGNGTKMSDKK